MKTVYLMDKTKFGFTNDKCKNIFRLLKIAFWNVVPIVSWIERVLQ